MAQQRRIGLSNRQRGLLDALPAPALHPSQSMAPPMLPIQAMQGAVAPGEAERAFAAYQAQATGMQAALAAQTAQIMGRGGGGGGFNPYLQSQLTKMIGGYDPRSGITWKTGRRKYGPGGENMLGGLSALGK